MLARRKLPEEYAAWNKRWGVPTGFSRFNAALREATRYRQLIRTNATLFGAFAFQRNSTTRTYEYPWIYQTIDPKPGMRVLEIGGALSGLQFVLACGGCEVHNVDPFFDYGSGKYAVDPARVISKLNHHFRTSVVLHQSTLDEAPIDGVFDVVYSVSTIEHMSEESLKATLPQMKKLVAPGGRIILTVDLFLNLIPFSERMTNHWGRNVSPKWIEDQLQMRLLEGERSELYGYPEFSVQSITATLEEYACNYGYPQLAQLMVFGA